MIDYRLLTFLTAAEIKNLTKTSQLLNITQPAVSQHIKYLEEFYNVKLFYKTGKTMELTEEGKFLYKKAIELDILSKSIFTDLNNRNSFLKKYKLGASLTIGGYTLPQIIGEHKKQHSNIDLILFVDNTKNILKKLDYEDIDFALIEGPFNKNKYSYEKFKEDELILVCSPNHEFSSKKDISIEEILSGNLILREIGSGTRALISTELIKLGYSLNSRIYMEIGDIHAIISLVLSNIGYTIISKEAVNSYLANGTLIQKEIIDLKLNRDFNFVYSKLSSFEFVNEFSKFCAKFN